MDITKQIISDMLVEKVNHYLGDSGGVYGYAHEKNEQNGIPTGKVKLDFFIKDNNTIEISPYVPIFDILRKNLEYTDECKMLEGQITDIEDIIKLVNIKSVFEEEEYPGTYVGYTYNNEYCVANQDFLYCFFQYAFDTYVGISIHNGCDARCGFTDTHIFEVKDIDNFLAAMEISFISCDCNKNSFSINMVYDDEEEYHLKNLYDNTYEDENGDLRCKHCNSLIMCEAF